MVRLAALALGILCGCTRPVGRDAGQDAGSADAAIEVGDAPPPSDVPFDARTADARVEAGVDAGSDTGRDVGGDGGRDTGPDVPGDAGPDVRLDGGSSGVVACAPEVPRGASTALVCSPMFSPGFQFEITTRSRVVALGVQGHADGSVPGSIHASLYRLSGMGAAPDVADPSDLLARTLLTLPPGLDSPIVAAPVDAFLDPGWYALVVGTGAHGATATSASIPSGGDRGCTSAPRSGFPFSLRASDGSLILQAASPHLFVVLE